MDKLIVSVALTGLIARKGDNPALPVSPEEIAADVRRCLDAGASIFHIHARDTNGNATWHPGVYARIAELCPDAVLCASTSGRIFREFSERSAVLDVRGYRMASLTMGSLNFPDGASVSEPATIRALASKMKRAGIVPELECFEIGHVHYTRRLIADGILKPPYFFNLFTGNPCGIEPGVGWLIAMVRELPPGVLWAGAGIGRHQFRANLWAMALGGHVRTGLEDNLLMLPGDLATNARLVERIVETGRLMGREPMNTEEVRLLLCDKKPV